MGMMQDAETVHQEELIRPSQLAGLQLKKVSAGVPNLVLEAEALADGLRSMNSRLTEINANRL